MFNKDIALETLKEEFPKFQFTIEEHSKYKKDSTIYRVGISNEKFGDNEYFMLVGYLDFSDEQLYDNFKRGATILIDALEKGESLDRRVETIV